MSKINDLLNQCNMSCPTDEWIEGYVFEDRDVLEQKFKEFGKYLIEESVEEMRKMQSAKYNAGETGYIDNEWRHILKEELKKKLL